MRRHTGFRTAAAATMALALLAAGCGDDAETSTEDTTEDASESEYCQLAVELDAQDDFPTVEQLEALQAAAPEEIADEIDIVVPVFVEAIEAGTPGNAFSDERIGDAFEPIDAYEADVCEIDKGEPEEEQDPSVTEADPSAAQLGVTATEYAFALEGTPAAGRTTLTMTNAGAEAHLMYLFQIAEGSTFDEVKESEGDEGIAADYESDSAVAGDTAVLTVDLVPGEYGMICYLPNADGESHDELGMVTQFTVA